MLNVRVEYREKLLQAILGIEAAKKIILKKYPRVVVYGCQDAGKSSASNAILLQELSFTKQNTATMEPVNIVTSSQEHVCKYNIDGNLYAKDREVMTHMERKWKDVTTIDYTTETNVTLYGCSNTMNIVDLPGFKLHAKGSAESYLFTKEPSPSHLIHVINPASKDYAVDADESLAVLDRNKEAVKKMNYCVVFTRFDQIVKAKDGEKSTFIKACENIKRTFPHVKFFLVNASNTYDLTNPDAQRIVHKNLETLCDFMDRGIEFNCGFEKLREMIKYAPLEHINEDNLINIISEIRELANLKKNELQENSRIYKKSEVISIIKSIVFCRTNNSVALMKFQKHIRESLFREVSAFIGTVAQGVVVKIDGGYAPSFILDEYTKMNIIQKNQLQLKNDGIRHILYKLDAVIDQSVAEVIEYYQNLIFETFRNNKKLLAFFVPEIEKVLKNVNEDVKKKVIEFCQDYVNEWFHGPEEHSDFQYVLCSTVVDKKLTMFAIDAIVSSVSKIISNICTAYSAKLFTENVVNIRSDAREEEYRILDDKEIIAMRADIELLECAQTILRDVKNEMMKNNKRKQDDGGYGVIKFFKTVYGRATGAENTA